MKQITDLIVGGIAEVVSVYSTEVDQMSDKEISDFRKLQKCIEILMDGRIAMSFTLIFII